MSDLRFTALGTSSLVPTRTRNHNGYHLAWRGTSLLFDCGEGTQRQLTHAGIGVRSLQVIALTHLHGDHCLGLPGVLQRISLERPSHPVVVTFPAESREYVERLHRASIYHDQAEIVFLPVEAADEPREILSTPRFVLSAASLDHRVPTVGYRVEEPPGIAFDKVALAERGIQGPRVGQLRREGRIEVDGRVTTLEEVSRPRERASLAFIMDTRPCRGAELLAKGVDLMVMEATYADDCAHLAVEHGHSTAAQAAEVAVAAGARRLALTHFSTRYTDTGQHLAEAGAIHPDVVTLEDLDQLTLTGSRG
ncbi:ribonuclease Z [Arachnia propionica]|uniref:Ribonuclease Z n=1 Tax=Arachnia propionica TaxID=1750 RepID=A0A3P1T750_9ACTN|nr:ribonuclease Z [Arachnia propionica]RRD05138.1 ribonuclease Z [Arachnia propionica]